MTFSPAALPNRTFSGTVKYISGEVREATRDVVVEAVVPNADGALMPGMFVNASLHAGEQPMPVVPKDAVFATGDEQSIYVVDDKRHALRIVKLGVEADDHIAIEEGAASGELAVLKPTASMSDGAPTDEAPMQWLARICVGRPVFTWVLMLLIMVLGGFRTRRWG